MIFGEHRLMPIRLRLTQNEARRQKKLLNREASALIEIIQAAKRRVSGTISDKRREILSVSDIHPS